MHKAITRPVSIEATLAATSRELRNVIQGDIRRDYGAAYEKGTEREVAFLGIWLCRQRNIKEQGLIAVMSST